MEISRIILGTVRFGTDTDKLKSFEIMNRYMALGGNAFDSARVYCDWIDGGSGASEKTVGEFVNSNGIRKNAVIITKGAHHIVDDECRTPRLSGKDITEDLYKSLDALNTDYIDVYLLHRDDPHREVGEIVEVMHRFVKEGLVKSIGVSNWKYDRIKKANEYAKKHSLTPLLYNQVEFGRAVINSDFNADPTVERLSKREYEKFAADSLGVNLMAYSSQSNGFFYKAKKLGAENLTPWLKDKFLNESTLYNLNLLTDSARKMGVSPAAVALSTVINDKLNIRAVVGANSTEQIEEIMSAEELGPKVMRELSEKLRK